MRVLLRTRVWGRLGRGLVRSQARRVVFGGGVLRDVYGATPQARRGAWGVVLWVSLTMTYFHEGGPHYHRRVCVSRSCSGREGVVPHSYGRQTLTCSSAFWLLKQRLEEVLCDCLEIV